MAQSTLKVFISSTNHDLFAHREAVLNAIMRLKNLHPIGMEHFGAQDGDASEVSLKEAAACDLFVGIYAYRYGYRPDNGLSVTEMEYRNALARDIPRLIFVVDEKQQDYEGWSNLSDNRDNEPEAQRLLADLKAELGRMRVWGTFTSPSDLAAKVVTALSNWMQEHPFEGWHSPTPPIIPLEKHFVGREKEIAEIRALFQRDSATSVTISISGTGGVGKSYLAFQLATLLKDDFPGGTFHAELGPGAQETAAVLAQIMPQWAQAHPIGRRSKPEDITPQKVKTWLAYEGKSGRILAILDDVWHDAPARALRDLLPPGSGCIITTRNRQLRLGGKIYELESLLPPDARKLLEARLGELGERGAIADRLIGLLEGHPLALEIAAAHIVDNGLPYLETYTDYVSRSMQSDSPFADLELEYGDNEREKSVEITLALSYEQLPDNLKTRFRTLGAFPIGLDYSERSVFALWRTDVSDLSQSKVTRADLLKLFQLNLIDQDKQTGRYSQHTLLHAYARALALRESEYEELNDVFIWHVVNDITLQFNNLPMELWDSEILPDREQIHYIGDHLVQGIQNRIENRLLLELLASPKPPFIFPTIAPELQGMLRAAENYATLVASYVIQRRIPEGVRWLHMGLICARIQEHKSLEGFFLNQLALWHQNSGYLHAAKEYHEANLALADSHATKAMARNGIASCDLALGNIERALENFQQALVAYQAEGSSEGEASILNNIGTVHRFRGSWDKALSFFERALVVIRKIDDKAGKASIIDNIGQCYLSFAEYDTALNYFDQALAIRREIGDHVGEATVLNNIAFIHQERGELEQAIKSMRYVVESYHEYGSVADEASALQNLARMLYENLNETEEAIVLLERSVAILEQYDLPQDSTGRTIGTHRMLLALMKGGKDFIHAPLPEGFSQDEAWQISIAITDLAYSPSPDAFRAIVERHRGLLLKPEVDILFETLLANLPDNIDGRLVEVMTRKRAVLTLCREHGIEAGFQRAREEGLIPSPPSIEEQSIVDAFWASMRVADLDSVKAAVEHYADTLLKPEADAVIAQLIDNAPPDFPKDMFESLQFHREILQLCREHGIEKGFEQAKEQGYVPRQQVRKEETIARAVWASLRTPDLASLRALLEQSSNQLLSPEADKVIQQIIDSAPDDADPEILEAMRQHRELLTICREVGIVEAFKRLEQKQTPSSNADEVP